MGIGTGGIQQADVAGDVFAGDVFGGFPDLLLSFAQLIFPGCFQGKGGVDHIRMGFSLEVDHLFQPGHIRCVEIQDFRLDLSAGQGTQACIDFQGLFIGLIPVPGVVQLYLLDPGFIQPLDQPQPFFLSEGDPGCLFPFPQGDIAQDQRPGRGQIFVVRAYAAFH